MKQTKKLVATALTVITLMFCFVTNISAANVTVGLLNEVRATQTSDSITLSWEKAENAKGYRIFKKVNGKWKAIKTTTAKQYTVTNLEEKTSYTFAVRPYTKVNGEVVWAKSYKTINTHTLGFVGNLDKITATQNSTSIILSWEKAQGAKGYRIFKKVNGKWKAIKTTTSTSYTVTGLDAETQYTFAVRPYTKVNGETVWAKSYKTIDTLTSGYVGNLDKVTATQNDTSVTLSWEKAQGAKGYRIFERVNGKWKALKTTTALKYTISGLDYGSKHTYAVRPYTKDNGKVIWAKAYAKITVNVEVPQVTGLNATTTTESITLRWNKVDGIKKYIVFTYNPDSKNYFKLKETAASTYTISNLVPGKTYKYAVQAYITIDNTEYWGKISSIATVTTDEGNYFIGVNGEKVYTDANGNQYYYDANGTKRNYDNDDNSGSNDYDTSVCIGCGKKDCGQTWDDFYCVICKKTIHGFTCHPKSHINASF